MTAGTVRSWKMVSGMPARTSALGGRLHSYVRAYTMSILYAVAMMQCEQCMKGSENRDDDTISQAGTAVADDESGFDRTRTLVGTGDLIWCLN